MEASTSESEISSRGVIVGILIDVMSLVIRDPISRPATSSTRREGMLEAEARFSIIIVTVDRSSILISVNGLLKSDFLFASHLNPLFLI